MVFTAQTKEAGMELDAIGHRNLGFSREPQKMLVSAQLPLQKYLVSGDTLRREMR
jgi:hypothetical protein